MIVDFHVEIGSNTYYEVSFDINELLKLMREFNISFAIITPAYGALYIYEFDKANQELHLMTKKYKELIGFGTVNPWFLDKSINELERIFKEYGFRGIKLIPYLQGFSINHKIVYPVMDYLAKHRAILYVPSGYHPQSPLEIADLADVYPEVNIVMGYAGFTDFWMELIPALKKHENLYTDISCQSNVRALKDAIMRLGSERFIFASSMPYSSIALELSKIDMFKLSDFDRENILWKNAMRLLRIPW